VACSQSKSSESDMEWTTYECRSVNSVRVASAMGVLSGHAIASLYKDTRTSSYPDNASSPAWAALTNQRPVDLEPLT
jgi:hypothetical protein